MASSTSSFRLLLVQGSRHFWKVIELAHCALCTMLVCPSFFFKINSIKSSGPGKYLFYEETISLRYFNKSHFEVLNFSFCHILSNKDIADFELISRTFNHSFMIFKRKKPIDPSCYIQVRCNLNNYVLYNVR